MIVRAPGKVVLFGEYAVLAGAPACVMAVNRLAQVELEPRSQQWSFASSGFIAAGIRSTHATFTNAPAARIAQTILDAWSYTQHPQPYAVRSDSSAFCLPDGTKLGIGSSAAVCVATYNALAKLLRRPANLAEATNIHRKLQGGKGSGLDVAAAWHGGTIRFCTDPAQDGVQAIDFPSELYWQVVFTGQAAQTQGHIASFDAWRTNNDTGPLQRLSDMAHLLTNEIDNLQAWQSYCEALVALDDAASLKIYTAAHNQLAKLASELDLVYKPCGAGGGDIGIALSPDLDALRRFAENASSHKFIPLDLETATHGVKFDD